jgi:hypothetical protein
MQVGAPAENFTGFIPLFVARKPFPPVHEGPFDRAAHKQLADKIAASQRPVCKRTPEYLKEFAVCGERHTPAQTDFT